MLHPNSNIGVGTATPSTALSIQGNDKALSVAQTAPYDYTGTAKIGAQLGAWGSGYANAAGTKFHRWTGSGSIYDVAYIGQALNGSGNWGLDFRTNTVSSFGDATTSRMFIAPSGNVGIGTTAPGAPLHTRFNQGTGTGKTLVADFEVRGDSSNTHLFFYGGGNGNASNFIETSGSEKLLLGSGDFPATLAVSGGRVGVGTASPSQKLDVVGNARVRSSLILGDDGSDNHVQTLGFSTGGGYDHMSLNTRQGAGSWTWNTNRPVAQLYARGHETTFAIWNKDATTTSDVPAIRLNSNDVSFLNGGNVGIGTTSPAAKLQVNGSSLLRGSVTVGIANAPANRGVFDIAGTNPGVGGASGYGFINFVAGDASTYATPGTRRRFFSLEDRGYLDWTLNSGGAGTFSFGAPTAYGEGDTLSINTSTRNVGIGTTTPSERLDVTGNINASGTVRASGTVLTSDERLKKNIRPLGSSLKKLGKLTGYTYDWKDKKKFSADKQIGVIAQEVQKVYPEAVQKGPDGFLAVSYTMLLAPVIEAIKELNELFKAQSTSTEREIASVVEENKAKDMEIAELKVRVRKAELDNALMNARLEKIEAALMKK